MQYNNSSFILITDSYPSPNGAGISQTLYNLFHLYPDKLYIALADLEDMPENGPKLEAEILRYPIGPWKLLANRLGKWINQGILRRQMAWQGRQPVPKNWPPSSAVSVLVSTTSAPKLLLAWCLLQQGYTVLPYFMDDWLAGNQLAWKGGDIQQVAMDILRAAPCWLMIGWHLENILVQRYDLKRKPCLVVHNPSPAPYQLPIEKEIAAIRLDQLKSENRNQKSEIIYAGSIWPMHLDALEALAKAIHLLNRYNSQPEIVEGPDFNFIVYTTDAAWQHNKKKLEGPGVSYGGFIPYAEMPGKLAKAWLLLVAASFEEKYSAFTNSSVQTKLTDYMAAGKPILMVGPVEGASTQFVHEWDCGYSINTSRPEDIAAQLLAIRCMEDRSSKKATNGKWAAEHVFSKDLVQEKLYNFLQMHLTHQQTVAPGSVSFLPS